MDREEAENEDRNKKKRTQDNESGTIEEATKRWTMYSSKIFCYYFLFVLQLHTTYAILHTKYKTSGGTIQHTIT